MTDSPASSAPIAPDMPAPGSILTRCAAATHVGKVRTTNEDSLLAQHPIFLIADGVGGHNAGEVASAFVVEEFRRLVGQPNVEVEQLAGTLRAAADRVNAIEPDDSEGPAAGTTVALVATTVVDGNGYWVVLNLGDSRVYRLTSGGLEQVSVDHSVVQELLDQGLISSERARHHPYRHMITRALGAGHDAEPDCWLIPAQVGDRLLICSDGLTDEVRDEALEDVLQTQPDLDSAAQTCVDLALQAGGHDNVSVVIVQAVDIVGAQHHSEDGESQP
ncbi:PP2C family protein-serine/threonine phosphatase [Devriesea agamarum]|uniref:PP2C family protein-serine/threonine phosphatase n=1 Tax=Devriesea agamarum TaxID=472569 RepID=UPI000A016167|nr:protein phosphatase 2C domain-containing protein [Devriesea agamarum]